MIRANKPESVRDARSACHARYKVLGQIEDVREEIPLSSRWEYSAARHVTHERSTRASYVARHLSEAVYDGALAAASKQRRFKYFVGAKAQTPNDACRNQKQTRRATLDDCALCPPWLVRARGALQPE